MSIDYSKFEGHTPGPWEVANLSGCNASDELYAAFHVGSTLANELIASLDGDYIERKHIGANAALIAAAPALLAENKALREEVERLKKRLEFPEPLWEEGFLTHPLAGDISMCEAHEFDQATPFHVCWGCGTSRYKTRKEAESAVRDSLKTRWNEIHSTREEVCNEG